MICEVRDIGDHMVHTWCLYPVRHAEAGSIKSDQADICLYSLLMPECRLQAATGETVEEIDRTRDPYTV